MYNNWEAVIGIEIHAQLMTQSKIFSGDSAEFTHGDNRHISAVSLGFPGTLPVLNENVVKMGIKAGLALNCVINKISIFERKNYFYPDLAKGYQISQFEKPLCGPGWVEFEVDGRIKKVNLERAHLEEDAGKSIHNAEGTLINYNRAGVALLEIVSAPEMSSPLEAANYAREVRQILRYAQVCDGNLEEGSLRCDCNVSIRKKGQKELGTRVELKNLNSFRFIEKALDYEIHRQIDVIESGDSISQETRLYDATKNKTYTMRSKEDSEDYRYFPDPDLLPVLVSEELTNSIKQNLPEMPGAKRERFLKQYLLKEDSVAQLTEESEVATFFEEVVAVCSNPDLVSSWIRKDVFRELNHAKIQFKELPISSKQLGDLLVMLDSKKINAKQAKDVLEVLWVQGGTPNDIVEKKGWSLVSNDQQLGEWVEKVLIENVDQVEELKNGKQKILSFLMGQVMKLSKGRADPEKVKDLIMEKIK